MSNAFEVPEPILNGPFAAPAHHWYIREGEEPQKRPGRRPSIVYPPRDERGHGHAGGLERYEIAHRIGDIDGLIDNMR
jgi:hypothetical protein